MDIVDRIFEIVDAKYNEQQEFSAALGLDPTIPSRWKKRKSTSYQKYLPQIADVLGTTTQYLLTGEGPKYKTSWPAPVSACFDPETLDVAAAYQQADERSRAMVRLALGLDDDMAIAARGGRVVKKPSPVSAETLDKLSRATAKAAEKENNRY